MIVPLEHGVPGQPAARTGGLSDDLPYTFAVGIPTAAL
jgi:hypothetical protein